MMVAKYARSNLTIVASSPWAQHSFQSRNWHSIASPSCHAWQPPNYGSSCSLISSLSLREITELETCISYTPQMSYLQEGKNERQNNRTRTNSRIEFPVYNFFIQSRISGITCFLLSETKDKKGTYSHTKCWKDTKITGIDTENQAAPLILVYTSWGL